MKVYRKDGNLIFEMPEDNVIFGAEHSPNYKIRVIDRELFLNHIRDRFLDLGDSGDFNGEPNINRFLDELVVSAIESAAGCDILDEPED